MQDRAYDEVASELGYIDPRTARTAVKRGRELWPRLWAWPWCCSGPKGRPPASWRAHGADPIVTAAFATWATGSPVLPATESAAA